MTSLGFTLTQCFLRSSTMTSRHFKLVILIWEVFFFGTVLPPYLPVFEGNQQDRDSIIENYFKLGISYKEIIAFLFLTHGIVLSLRQLKRILRNRGLFRRRNAWYSNYEEVIRAIEIELQGKLFMH